MINFPIAEAEIFRENLVNTTVTDAIPDGKVHGANMGPIWGRQDPGGPYVGPMNFAIWDGFTILDKKILWMPRRRISTNFAIPVQRNKMKCKNIFMFF